MQKLNTNIAASHNIFDDFSVAHSIENRRKKCSHSNYQIQAYASACRKTVNGVDKVEFQAFKNKMVHFDLSGGFN